MAGVCSPSPRLYRSVLLTLLLPALCLRSPLTMAESVTENQVIEVRVVGNHTMPTSKIAAELITRAGRPFDPDDVQRDVRKLLKSGQFLDVRPLYQSAPGGRVIIFEVQERPTLRWVKYLGNRKMKNKHLIEETGLKVGDPIDPYAIEEGRRKIEDFYHKRGFNRVQVEVLEGIKPGDLGATYVIHEGPAEQILQVKFVGNTVASDSRLKTKIQSKPGIFWMFRGSVDRQKIDSDVDRLTAYYRSLGFFRARVGREIEFSKSGKWLTLTFVIDEGQRYKVRTVSFLGNQKFSSDTLAQDLRLTNGQFFDQSAMNTDLTVLRDLYGSEGHVFANVEADPRFLEEPGILDLVYKIDEGRRFRVGEIKVNIGGENPHTRIQTVLNRLELRTGDIMDVRKLRRDERRLKSSGLFANDPARGVAPKIIFRPPKIQNRNVAKNRERQESYRGQSPEERTLELQLCGQWRDDCSASPTVPPDDPQCEERRSEEGRPGFVVRGQTQTGRPAYGGPTPQTSYGGQGLGHVGPRYQPQMVSQNFNEGPRLPGPVQPYPVPGASPEPLPNMGPNGQIQAYPPPYYEPLADPAFDPSLPLEVQVAETQTGRFMVGVGVNSEAGLVGSIVIDERNFDWRRWPRSFDEIRNGTAWRGAGQRFRLELLPGNRVQRYLVNFQEPYLLDTPVSLGLSGFYFDRRYFDWDEQRLGGRVSLGYQITPDLSGTLAYRGENVNIHDIREPAPQELLEVVGDNRLNGFKFTLAHDTRDSPFLPTQGHFIELAGEQVVGTWDYPRATADLRQYFLIYQRIDGSGSHVLSLGTRLGFSGSNTPIYDHFFAGGFTTLRGFRFRGASPRVMDITVGGDFMFIGSAEYLLPVTADDMLRAVAFCDFGTVEPNVEINNFRISPGVGLRVTVPALGPAPIALDFAYPVVTAPGDERQLFSFNVGLLR